MACRNCSAAPGKSPDCQSVTPRLYSASANLGSRRIASFHSAMAPGRSSLNLSAKARSWCRLAPVGSSLSAERQGQIVVQARSRRIELERRAELRRGGVEIRLLQICRSQVALKSGIVWAEPDGLAKFLDRIICFPALQQSQS